MILSNPEHFWFKNHDFSARAPNCLVYLVEAVQNMKINVFRKVPRKSRFSVNTSSEARRLAAAYCVQNLHSDFSTKMFVFFKVKRRYMKRVILGV